MFCCKVWQDGFEYLFWKLIDSYNSVINDLHTKRMLNKGLDKASLFKPAQDLFTKKRNLCYVTILSVYIYIYI